MAREFSTTKGEYTAFRCAVVVFDLEVVCRSEDVDQELVALSMQALAPEAITSRRQTRYRLWSLITLECYNSGADGIAFANNR